MYTNGLFSRMSGAKQRKEGKVTSSFLLPLSVFTFITVSVRSHQGAVLAGTYKDPEPPNKHTASRSQCSQHAPVLILFTVSLTQ